VLTDVGIAQFRGDPRLTQTANGDGSPGSPHRNHAVVLEIFAGRSFLLDRLHFLSCNPHVVRLARPRQVVATNPARFGGVTEACRSARQNICLVGRRSRRFWTAFRSRARHLPMAATEEKPSPRGPALSARWNCLNDLIALALVGAAVVAMRFETTTRKENVGGCACMKKAAHATKLPAHHILKRSRCLHKKAAGIGDGTPASLPLSAARRRRRAC